MFFSCFLNIHLYSSLGLISWNAVSFSFSEGIKIHTLCIYIFSNLSICFGILYFWLPLICLSLEAVRDVSPVLVSLAFHASWREAWDSPWEAPRAWERLVGHWAPVWGVWGEVSWLFPCSAVSAVFESRTSLTQTWQNCLPSFSVVRVGGHVVRSWEQRS